MFVYIRVFMLTGVSGYMQDIDIKTKFQIHQSPYIINKNNATSFDPISEDGR